MAYLRRIGIRRNSCASILAHLQGSAFEPRRLTLAVEGNISAGKTTFLKLVGEGARAAAAAAAPPSENEMRRAWCFFSVAAPPSPRPASPPIVPSPTNHPPPTIQPTTYHPT